MSTLPTISESESQSPTDDTNTALNESFANASDAWLTLKIAMEEIVRDEEIPWVGDTPWVTSLASPIVSQRCGKDGQGLMQNLAITGERVVLSHSPSGLLRRDEKARHVHRVDLSHVLGSVSRKVVVSSRSNVEAR